VKNKNRKGVIKREREQILKGYLIFVFFLFPVDDYDCLQSIINAMKEKI